VDQNGSRHFSLARALVAGNPVPDEIGIRIDSMNSDSIEVILKRFERPDEIRILTKGKFETVRLGGMTIGRATYEPGWRWSEHVGPSVGASRCQVEHVGMVLAGTATAAFDDGRVVEMHRGDLFHIPPVPHDSWVVGNEPYISLHFLGADHYAK
jgi:hypothetical protein